eukprot:3189061-Alexandrium_andersonii.AAC.1
MAAARRRPRSTAADRRRPASSKSPARRAARNRGREEARAEATALPTAAGPVDPPTSGSRGRIGLGTRAD